MRTEPDSVIVCDKCGARDAESEESAIAEGWIIDSSTEPHKHFCPDCMDAVA